MLAGGASEAIATKMLLEVPAVGIRGVDADMTFEPEVMGASVAVVDTIDVGNGCELGRAVVLRLVSNV